MGFVGASSARCVCDPHEREDKWLKQGVADGQISAEDTDPTPVRGSALSAQAPTYTQ
jgi:hypothetical protein